MANKLKGAFLCQNRKVENSDIGTRELPMTKLWQMTPVSWENNIHWLLLVILVNMTPSFHHLVTRKRRLF